MEADVNRFAAQKAKLLEILERNGVKHVEKSQEEKNVVVGDNAAVMEALQGKRPLYEDGMEQRLAEARAKTAMMLADDNQAERIVPRSTVTSTEAAPAWTSVRKVKNRFSELAPKLLIGLLVAGAAMGLFQLLMSQLSKQYSEQKRQDKSRMKMAKLQALLKKKEELRKNGLPSDNLFERTPTPEDLELLKELNEIEEAARKVREEAQARKAAVQNAPPGTQESASSRQSKPKQIKVRDQGGPATGFGGGQSKQIKVQDQGGGQPTGSGGGQSGAGGVASHSGGALERGEERSSPSMEGSDMSEAGTSGAEFVPDFGRKAGRIRKTKVKQPPRARSASEIIIGKDEIEGFIYMDGETDLKKAVRREVEAELDKDPRMRAVHLRTKQNRDQGRDPAEGIAVWELEQYMRVLEKGQERGNQAVDEWIERKKRSWAGEDSLSEKEKAARREKAEFMSSARDADVLASSSASQNSFLEQALKISDAATRTPPDTGIDEVPALSHTRKWVEELRQRREEEGRIRMERPQQQGKPTGAAAAAGSAKRDLPQDLRAEFQGGPEEGGSGWGGDGKGGLSTSQSEWRESVPKPKNLVELGEFLKGKAPPGSRMVGADPEEFFGGEEDDDITPEEWEAADRLKREMEARVEPMVAKWKARIDLMGKEKFIEEHGEELGVSMVSKRTSEEREQARNWWRSLPYVLTILLGYDGEEAELSMDLSGGQGSHHILGFESSEDAQGFVAWAKTSLPTMAFRNPTLRPTDVNELAERAEKAGCLVTVLKKGELKVGPTTTLQSVEQNLQVIAEDPKWVEALEKHFGGAGGLNIESF